VDESGRWVEAKTSDEPSFTPPLKKAVIDALRAHTLDADVECGELDVLAECGTADGAVVFR